MNEISIFSGIELLREILSLSVISTSGFGITHISMSLFSFSVPFAFDPKRMIE
ncbi:MAG: hypothetical protein OIN87_11705 [Candidatus Methanoperedens sp.]|nr:hypothetical protein [Candidatus Methanoperedens sp.]